MANDLMPVVRASKYPLDAFLFVRRGLDFTVRRIHGEGEAQGPPQSPPQSRHVSGRDLCEGLRDYAVDQYGLLAGTVLRRWHLTGTEDFGHIVFAMIEAKLMQKTEQDTFEDFVDVYDFSEAFRRTLQLSK